MINEGRIRNDKQYYLDLHIIHRLRPLTPSHGIVTFIQSHLVVRLAEHYSRDDHTLQMQR